MKLIEKKKINARYYKRYDKPQTPYQRLLACPDMASTVKNKLKKQHDKLNPFELKCTIENKLKHIFTLVSVTFYFDATRIVI